MTKIAMLLVLGLLVLSIGGVSAQTLISGTIYNADYTSTVAGAAVTVTCNGNVETATSLSDGTYSVSYAGNDSCSSGDSLTVSATKDNLYGSKTGIIHDKAFDDWNLAVVNVPLVPEFGAIVGALTVLGALGIFFVVRRS